MESTLALYQLIILYMLKHSGGKVSRPMISQFLLENGYVNFVSLTAAYANLEEAGFAVSSENGGLSFLSVTPEGEETLHFFEQNISPEIRKQVDDYLLQKGHRIRTERDISAEYYQNGRNGYTVRMTVRENGISQVLIELSVPDEESAKAIADGFRRKSEEICSTLISQLYS